MTAACVTEFVRLVERGLLQLEGDELTDKDLSDVMTAAIRLYAARAEARDVLPQPLNAEKITATDVATVVSEMVRTVDLNMFDLSMWHARTRRSQ